MNAQTSSELFALGWDMYAEGARLYDNLPGAVRQGYNEARTRRVKRKDAIPYWTSKWATLRLHAIQRGIYFDNEITPAMLAFCFNEEAADGCPVTGKPFTRGTGLDTDLSIDRIVNSQPYLASNLTVMSVKANKAKDRLGIDGVMDILEKVGMSDDEHEGIAGPGWFVLATLLARCWPWDDWQAPAARNKADFSIRAGMALEINVPPNCQTASYRSIIYLAKSTPTSWRAYRGIVRRVQRKIKKDDGQFDVLRHACRRTMDKHWGEMYAHIPPAAWAKAVAYRNRCFGWRSSKYLEDVA